jgi:hypothetical protein
MPNMGISRGRKNGHSDEEENSIVIDISRYSPSSGERLRKKKKKGAAKRSRGASAMDYA